MIIKLQKVCLTSICNENKSCKGHTNLHTLLTFWIYEMANMICKPAVIEALKCLVWNDVLVNSFHLPYHASTECLTKCIPIGNFQFTSFLKCWCHCSFTPTPLIQGPPWNPLIEHNEQSAFCNITCCILKKVLAMNPYKSQAWWIHGEHSITNCVKFFFLDIASTVHRIVSLRSSSKHDVINVVHRW